MRAPLAASLAAAAAIALAGVAAATPAFDSPASVAAGDFGFDAWRSPALAGTRYPSEFSLAWGEFDPDRSLWAGQLAAGGFTLAGLRRPDVDQRWRISLAGGDPEQLRFGMASTLEIDEALGDERTWDHQLGALTRPHPALSLGATVDHLGQPRHLGERLIRDWTLGVGLRPFAMPRAVAHTLGPRLTLTADVAWREDQRREAARARVGVEVEPIRGVMLRGQAWREGFTLGVSVLGPRSGSHSVSGWTRRDGTTDHAFHVHTLSMHRAEDPTVLIGRRDPRVAVVRIGGALADEPAAGSLIGGGGGGTIVKPIHDQLERAARDPLTRAVLLELRGTAGLAQVEELLPRLDRLRAAGKPVIAFMETGGERADLLLAAACDESFATPRAMFAALGLRTERRSYRALLERLGITVERTSIGRYKSAWRPFSVDSTTDADEESIVSLLEARQRAYVTQLAAEADVPAARFEHVLDGRPWTSADLVAAGLLDSIGYREQAVARAGALARLGAKPSLARLDRAPEARREWNVPARLAVVYASGGIETGRSGSDLWSGSRLGHETLIAQLERAFSRRSVEAVVLRVDSPGGSALASDLIHHATLRLKREKRKPLIASMGGVAASGGYYIAMGADQVWASPSTITGSIGVVSIKPSLEGLWAKQGVRQEAWQRGEYMGGWSIHQDWTAREQAIADSATMRWYRAFVADAATDRGLPYGEIEAHAQGRVWLGAQALERRLIDKLGGLDDALAEARRRAGIPAAEKIRVLEFRRPRGGLIERVIGGWVRETIARETRLPEMGESRFEAELPVEP